MTEQLVFRLPDVPNGIDPCQHVASLLRKAGLNPSDAQRLVDDELEITSVTSFKSLTKLLEGQYSERGQWIEASEESQAAGAKLLSCLSWDGITSNAPEPLTSEEKALVMVQTLDVSVRTGFSDRVATYAKNKRQLLAILKVFQPTVISAGIKDEGPNSKREMSRRLIAAAAEVLGVEHFTEGD